MEIVNILNTFSRVLGQKINYDKSMIMFNPKTLFAQRQFFFSMLGMRMVDTLDSYLGLPLPVTKKKSQQQLSLILLIDALVGLIVGESVCYPMVGKRYFLKPFSSPFLLMPYLFFLPRKGLLSIFSQKYVERGGQIIRKTVVGI